MIGLIVFALIWGIGRWRGAAPWLLWGLSGLWWLILMGAHAPMSGGGVLARLTGGDLRAWGLFGFLAALVALATMAVLLIWLTRPTSTLAWTVSPSEVSFPVVASRFGESCFDACKRVDMMCQASYFPYLNDCKRLRKQLGYGDAEFVPWTIGATM